MKRVAMLWIIAVMSLATCDGFPFQIISLHLSSVGQTKDWSLLRPNDSAYADAMKFSRFLQNNGFTVRSVHRSKLESFFDGVNKAAFIRTDEGIIEVIFFDDPNGAEQVRVSEERPEAGRYIYSFKGQPNPNLHDRIDSNRPMYFIMHKDHLIVTDDKELDAKVKEALKRG